MKVTHDQVRALLDSHREELCERHDAEDDAECSLCGLHAIGLALCEEWLARRTVRIDTEHGNVTNGLGEHIGALVKSEHGPGFVAVWGEEFWPPQRPCATVDDARAALEEFARAEGFEVVS